MERPFFFLCLLEDSSLLSKLGFGLLRARLSGLCRRLRSRRNVIDLVRSSGGLLDGGQSIRVRRSNCLESTIVGRWRGLAEGETISTPMELLPPLVAAGAAVAPGTLVMTADEVARPVAAAGTSCSCRGAAGAAGVAGVSAARSCRQCPSSPAWQRLQPALPPGFIAALKSSVSCLVTCGASVGLGSASVGSPSRGCHYNVRLVHNEQRGAILETILPAAVFERDAGGDLLRRRCRDGQIHRGETVARILDVRRGRVLKNDLAIGIGMPGRHRSSRAVPWRLQEASVVRTNRASASYASPSPTSTSSMWLYCG